MAKHNKVGKRGELLAIEYLKKKGFTILETNWRYSHWEIDVIASKGGNLHIVEVKTRSNDRYGYPEEAVTDRKLRFLAKAANQYLINNPKWEWLQYDILSITLEKGGEPEFYFMEDIDLT